MNPAIPTSSTSTWPDRKDNLISESSPLPEASGVIVCAQPRWLHSEASIGLPCCSLGVQKCWEVTGPAHDISQRLLRDVKDILDQHGEYLHNNVSAPFSLMFGLFMIGKSEHEASPTLVISCEPELARQRAVNIIRRCGILTLYPGVLLAGSSQSPTSLGQVQSLGARRAVDSDFVFFTPPASNNVCGRSIHVMERSAPENLCPTSIHQKATMGGFVRLRTSEHDDLYCGITVAHAFEDEFSLPPAGLWMDLAFEGEIPVGAFDDLGDILVNNDSDSHLVEHVSQLCNMINVLSEDRTYLDTVKNMVGQGIGDRLASSLNGEHPNLDWALVEIQCPHTEPANTTSIDWITGQCQLNVERVVPTITKTASTLVVTSTGIQTGFISAASTFYKSPYGVSFEEVYVVRLDGRLDRGDSGCWVIDPESGDLYGHIVAGCPESKVAYLVPAYRIFKDIREQLGGTVELACRTPIATHDPSEGHQLPKPVGTNQTDEEIMRQLQMSRAIFEEMLIETEIIYQALVANPSNLRQYVKKSSLYSWHDLSDKAKYEAIIRLSSSTNPRTEIFWARGQAGQNGANMLARWFPFRRFRLVGMSRQRRFGGTHPENLDLMFVARPVSRTSNRPGGYLRWQD